MRLLLVEDDQMVAQAVRDGLLRAGFTVDRVIDGAAADSAVLAEPYALVLLDLGLPRRDGLTILRAWRTGGLQTPVLILTARDAIQDRIAGLDAGADDYLVKPFSVDELLARVRAILRREAGRRENLITHGHLSIDLARRQVALEGRAISLTAKEFALLELLAAHPESILSRAQLEERLYGWGEEICSNAVEVHIHHLRKKIGSDIIRNVRGIGYAIGPPP